MSVVNILNIQVLDNPTRFTNPFQFVITFECTSTLQDGNSLLRPADLEWKIVYVGSAEDEQYDQTLDCIMVGPVPVGVNKFVFQADAPNPALIPASDITGVTVVLITCSYRGQEFVRVGYYVNNEYDSEELKAEPPATPLIDRLVRNILADKPRVTRFPIRWDQLNELEAPPAHEEGMSLEGGEPLEDEQVDRMMSQDFDADETMDDVQSVEQIEASPEHNAIAVNGELRKGGGAFALAPSTASNLTFI